MHSHPGFNSTSTLFYGERDAVLIDATQLLSDAHRLAADLIDIGKNITHIYVSHFHPDHHFGAGVLKSAFPRAHVVALPSVVKDIVFTTNDKVDMWGDFFGKNEPETVTLPHASQRAPARGGRTRHRVLRRLGGRQRQQQRWSGSRRWAWSAPPTSLISTATCG